MYADELSQSESLDERDAVEEQALHTIEELEVEVFVSYEL